MGSIKLIFLFFRTFQVCAAISVDYSKVRSRKMFAHQRIPECHPAGDEGLFHGSMAQKSYGFMVAIMKEEYQECLCGASLLDDRHLLTAGHCARHIDEALSRGVRLEAWIAPRDLERFHGQKIPVFKIIRHEDFEPRPVLHNDIAIAFLASPVKFHWGIQTVCIGLGDYHGRDVTLIGFGNYDCYNPSAVLRTARGHAIDAKSCKRNGHKGTLLESQLCARLYSQEGIEAEQAPGDSGGPLFLSDPFAEAGIRDYIQVGTVSYNYIRNGTKDLDGDVLDPCPNLRIPGTYTRLASFKSFIQTIVPNARREWNTYVETNSFGGYSNDSKHLNGVYVYT